MKPTTTAHLIKQAQRGNREATELLFRLIRDEHMPRRVRRHYARNVLVEPAEIDSEFLLGCWRALPRAKLDVGNPLMFMCYKGEMAVVDLFRSKIEKGVLASCGDCGQTKNTLMKAGRPTCRSCGSRNVTTTMQEVNETSLARPDGGADSGHVFDAAIAHSGPGVVVRAEAVWFLATRNIQVEEMRARLNGRVLQLFDLLVTEEINSATSKNYLKEIAGRWGVSVPCVAVYLRKLRALVEEYFDAA